MRVLIPSEEGKIFRAWIKYYRPILMTQLAKKVTPSAGKPIPPTQLHQYLFVKKDGSAPRSEILSPTVALQKLYLDGKSATPHRFRGMQATDGQEAGISSEEMRAMCAGRQHTTHAAEKYYVKRNRKR